MIRWTDSTQTVKMNELFSPTALASQVLSDRFLSLLVAQWVRRWSSNHRAVQAEGSSPRGNVYQTFFSNEFYVRPNGLQ